MIDKNLIQERISKVIHENDIHAEVYLFGSRSRGNSMESSDWDILILVDSEKVTDEIENKFRDGLYDIELEYGVIISIFIYPKNYWKNVMVHSPLYKSVDKEGILL